MDVRITIEPADALAAMQPDEEVISHIVSALYGRMGDFGWRRVQVDRIPEAKDE
jgi:hypothetical protein